MGHVFKPWEVDTFWDISPCSEGDRDWAKNMGGEARAQPPVLPCQGMRDFRMGAQAGKGAGGENS